MKPEEIENIIRQTLNEKEKSDKVVSSGDAEVDRVAYYLQQINDREEMLLAIPLMFKKIMSYPDHSVTTGEFKKALYNSFGDDDANVLFSVLSRVDVEDEEEMGEEPQDSKDKEDERLAAKDRKASDRERKGAKFAQTLADRRRESEGATKESKQPTNSDSINEDIRKAFKRFW